MTHIRVVAAVVDTRQLTLYKEDGSTVLIPQGDVRLRNILDEITPIIAKGAVAIVDLAEENNYQNFEQKSGGFARFFRVAKAKVASFFNGDEPVEYQVIGSIPESSPHVPTKLSHAIDSIMEHAVPAGDTKFAEQPLSKDDTVIAVVGTGKNAKIIPGMENLEQQFAYALKLGSTIGVQNLLRRLAAVIDQRRHSVHDLLRFLERADLPIADDGSIIIYKALSTTTPFEKVAARGKGIFYDIHSKQVPQQVGSYVCMDPSMVDPNRRNECSNGLHVARRAYLANFHGDVCVLAKLAPEDVIAVPNYDANKMRVCGYHILFELPHGDYQKLLQNKPMTDSTSSQSMLGRAIRGDHKPPHEEVRITGSMGQGVVITKLDHKGKKIEPLRGRTAPMAVALDDTTTAPGSVDPKTISEQVTKIKAEEAAKPTAALEPVVEPAKIKQSPRQLEATRLWAIMTDKEISVVDRKIAAGNLQQFKKSAKVSWTTLGLEDSVAQTIAEVIAIKTEPEKPVAPLKGVKKKKASKPKAKSKAASARVVASPSSRQAKARELFDEANFAGLLAHKKSAKIGWERLGFDASEIEIILSEIQN